MYGGLLCDSAARPIDEPLGERRKRPLHCGSLTNVQIALEARYVSFERDAGDEMFRSRPGRAPHRNHLILGTDDSFENLEIRHHPRIERDTSMPHAPRR